MTKNVLNMIGFVIAVFIFFGCLSLIRSGYFDTGGQYSIYKNYIFLIATISLFALGILFAIQFLKNNYDIDKILFLIIGIVVGVVAPIILYFEYIKFTIGIMNFLLFVLVLIGILYFAKQKTEET